jgi:enediyne biosynthesis protein E4
MPLAVLGFSAFVLGILCMVTTEKDVQPILFSDMATAAGLTFTVNNDASPRKYQIETMPGGVAVIDYDNDGLEDLYFTNGASIPSLVKTDRSYWNRLYRNNGNFRFTDVTEKAGVAGEGYSMAAAVADYDNDGRQDLFVAGVNRNTLYHNDGGGAFTDVTGKVGIRAGGPGKMWSISAGWFDFDNDGWLDLFVVNYCRWAAESDPYCGGDKPGYRTYCSPKMYEGLPNTLYHNNGDGTFSDVSVSSGIAAHVGKGMAVAFADYNADGRVDAFVTNDTERNFLFRNDGAGRFSEVGLQAGVAFNSDGRAASSMGADFRDVDNDGRPDIVVTALSNETFALYRNLGSSFRDASYSSQLAVLTLPWAGWGVGIFDLNNDGFKDVFAANAHVEDNIGLYSSRTYRQPNCVLANHLGARFVDVRQDAGDALQQPRAHRCCAFADFDNDGRVDVAVSCLNEPAELLRNTSSPRQHWFQLVLHGRRSNRDAIGAAVRLISASGRVQHNHVSTAVGYASSSSRRLQFGLDAETEIASVEIRWPSGVTQVLTRPRADQCLRVTEPEQ